MIRLNNVEVSLSNYKGAGTLLESWGDETQNYDLECGLE